MGTKPSAGLQVNKVCPVTGIGHHSMCGWYEINGKREYWSRCVDCGLWQKLDETLGLGPKDRKRVVVRGKWTEEDE